MRKNYEQAIMKLFTLNEDVIMVSGTEQLSFGNDNVVSWWGMEGNSHE